MLQKQPIIIKKQESTVEQMKISPNHGREGNVFESTEQQKNYKIEAKQGRKWAEVAKTPTSSKIQNPRLANGKFPGDVIRPSRRILCTRKKLKALTAYRVDPTSWQSF